MKKGFTLAELLGVLVLISIIAILVINSIIKNNNKNNNKISETTKQLIYSATDSYLTENGSEYEKNTSNRYCIKLRDLVDNENLTENIYDADTGDLISLDYYVEVQYNKKWYFELKRECTEIK